MASTAMAPGNRGNPRMTLARREGIAGWIWVQAWLLGFLLFGAFPMLASLVLGFTDWDGVGAPKWIGLQNYRTLLLDDPLFWQSLKVTFVFSVLFLPASLVIGFSMALLMNQKLRGMSVFRTVYYLPSVLSGVAVALLWQFVFHREFGVMNGLLAVIGIEPVPWLTDRDWVIPALVIMQLWGVGASIIIYLGGLQGIPSELYEVARIDGAGWWPTLRNVTLPMMSPVLFFQLVLGIIGTLQIFTQAYVMTGGGPEYGSYFYAFNLYERAFQELRLGYASAMSWILFLIIVAITLLIFRFSKSWVYYAGGRGQ